MAQKPEDFNLPMNTVTKIIKDALPSGVRVTNGAKVALSKAASVFVLYATTGANSFALEKNRKTLTGQDILDALIDLDLDMLVAPLHQALEEYKQNKETKKQEKVKKKAKKGEEEEDDDDNGGKDEKETDEQAVLDENSDAENCHSSPSNRRNSVSSSDSNNNDSSSSED